MSERRTILLTLERLAAPPSLAEAAARLGLPEEALVAAFGVVPVDPAAGRYCVEAYDDLVPKGPNGEMPENAASNPPIAPFGRPDK